MGLQGVSGYDPLADDANFVAEVVDREIYDTDRKRVIPLRIYLPVTRTASPVVLFSHGLGGSRENNAYLGNHWASRGYVAVFMQHLGSDESVWKDASEPKRYKSLQAAASRTNVKLRVEDVSSTLDQLQRWQLSSDSSFSGRMDLEHVGMSGHSFGAVTTQAVSGQQQLIGFRGTTDDRIDAALAMSPSPPRIGSALRAFSSVEIPWLLMTGTEDVASIGGADVAARLSVFPALPAGDKFELVLFDASHSAFSDRALPSDRTARNAKHHQAILALSTAFWDAYLRGDTAAAAWLTSDAARAVLEPKDQWQWK
ncbi:alpha/beta hydrolase family protein [Coraliomargarita sp. W4R53]